MSNVAQALIEEYTVEVKERIDDDKNLILARQGFSLIETINKLFVLSIFSFVIIGFISLCFITVNISEHDIQALMNSTAQEIEHGIKLVMYFFTAIWLFCLIVTIAIFHGRYIRNIKQERLDKEQENLEQMKLIVSVCDELIKRHNLIKNEVAINE